MGRKSLWVVVSIALLLGISACGATSDAVDSSESGKKTEAKEMVTIIRNGDTILLDDVTALQEQLEDILCNECKKPLMLSLQLTEEEVESYKDGIYIEIIYEDGKVFSEITGSLDTKIENVYFLMKEDSLVNYIMYYTGKSSRVFSLSQASRDVIASQIRLNR